MQATDIEAVVAMEHALFAEQPWSARTFIDELSEVDSRYYVVAVDRDLVTNESTVDSGPHVVGYAGLCCYDNEAHVLTIGVRSDRQRQGIGRLLLDDLLAVAAGRGIRRIILEVRASDDVAQHLYVNCGFRQMSIRKRYYQPSGEDAVVMIREV